MRAALFLFVFSCLSFANDSLTTVTEVPLNFFQRISGRYAIDLIDGEKPHNFTVGTVVLDDDIWLMSFSTCFPEGCDPNDQYFPLENVTITKTTVSDSAISYELRVTDNGNIRRFTWDEVSGQVILKNYQYLHKGQLKTLEHQFHRLTEE